MFAVIFNVPFLTQSKRCQGNKLVSHHHEDGKNGPGVRGFTHNHIKCLLLPFMSSCTIDQIQCVSNYSSKQDAKGTKT